MKDKAAMAKELGIGEITLTDILKELEKPARDPREDMPKPILRSDVLDMKDLKPGMILKGTVRNVIDFGAFVDIGVHQDGLVHISRMADRFIRPPSTLGSTNVPRPVFVMRPGRPAAISLQRLMITPCGRQKLASWLALI